LRERDLTLGDLGSQFVKEVSSVDGKLFRSARFLLTSPGKLTAAYIAGERRRFLQPVGLFLVGNAVFFGVQSLTQSKILSSSLASHLHRQDWSELARHMVAGRLAVSGKSLAAYSTVFDAAAVFNAKALVILMVIAFAPIVGLIYKSRHKPVGAHVVFALHLYTFVLMLLSVSLLVAHGEMLLGGDGLQSDLVDHVLALFNLAACGTYIYLALGPVYGAQGRWRVAQAAFLAVTVAAVFTGYRFVIFLITLYST
jgi:hypothetical protein